MLEVFKRIFFSILLYLDPIIDKLECILFTETWFTKDTCDHYSISGFEATHIFKKGKRGGGMSVYVRSNIIYTSVKKLNIITNDYEFNFIKIGKQYTNLSKHLVIGTCYRPPSGYLDNLFIKLNDVYEDLEKLNYFQYLIGDFNIDMLKGDIDQDIQLFLSQQVSSAMLPLITIPTRVTSSSSTLIESIIASRITFCLHTYHTYSSLIYLTIIQF